jgi:mRNA turnover protein 4
MHVRVLNSLTRVFAPIITAVSLTQVKKKDRGWKEGLVSQIQQNLDNYPSVFLLRYENFRNEAFKNLREKIRDTSTFCLGSNKVLKVAIGKSDAEEYKTNLHLLANDIRGNSALLFTKLPQADVERMVDSFEVLDYARAGSEATEEFAIPAGPVLQWGEPIAHTMEPTLRKHGMPTKLNKGVVELLTDYTVCREGETLTPDKAALLKIFGVQMATFRMRLVGKWEGDAYEKLGEDSEEDGEE